MKQTSSRTRAIIVAEARAHDGKGTAVIATDAGGSVVYWNDLAASLYGWHREFALGRNVLEMLPMQHDADEAERIMKQLQRGDAWAGTFNVRNADGTPVFAKVTNIPIRDGDDIIGIVGVSRRATAADRVADVIGETVSARPLPQSDRSIDA